jgi:hypothetical protein
VNVVRPISCVCRYLPNISEASLPESCFLFFLVDALHSDIVEYLHNAPRCSSVELQQRSLGLRILRTCHGIDSELIRRRYELLLSQTPLVDTKV